MYFDFTQNTLKVVVFLDAFYLFQVMHTWNLFSKIIKLF